MDVANRSSRRSMVEYRCDGLRNTNQSRGPTLSICDDRRAKWVDEYAKPEFWIATDASDAGWGIVIYETGVKEWGEFRYPEASDIFVKEMFALCRGILQLIDGDTPMEICAMWTTWR